MHECSAIQLYCIFICLDAMNISTGSYRAINSYMLVTIKHPTW